MTTETEIQAMGDEQLTTNMRSAVLNQLVSAAGQTIVAGDEMNALIDRIVLAVTAGPSQSWAFREWFRRNDQPMLDLILSGRAWRTAHQLVGLAQDAYAELEDHGATAAELEHATNIASQAKSTEAGLALVLRASFEAVDPLPTTEAQP